MPIIFVAFCYNCKDGTTFGDLVGELEKLGDYVVNVVEARFGQM